MKRNSAEPPHFRRANRLKEARRVALLIESSRAYGRSCLVGVARYVRAHQNWSVLHLERGLDESVPRLVSEWSADGLLTRVNSHEAAEAVNRLELPTVDLRGSHCPQRGAMLDTDHVKLAEIAAQHFRELGFRNFAFCGYQGVDFSDKRCAAFVDHLHQQLGHPVEVFRESGNTKNSDVVPREASGELESTELVAWLSELPRPIAILACNDVRGRQVLNACAVLKLNVPEQVAVVGVDDDEVICELSVPPLSSIEPDAEALGYQAAAILDRILEGEQPPAETIYVQPRGLRIRLSSEAMAIEDEHVAEVMRLIRARACQQLNVEDLLNSVSVSRSTLERRFRKLIGRSPAAQIERQRIERAKLLLAETNYKLARVATMTGYCSAAQFVKAFKRSVGITPGNYRKASGGTPWRTP